MILDGNLESASERRSCIRLDHPSIPSIVVDRRVIIRCATVRSQLPEPNLAFIADMDFAVVALRHESSICKLSREVNEPNGRHSDADESCCNCKYESRYTSAAVEVPRRTMTASDLEPRCQVRVPVAII